MRYASVCDGIGAAHVAWKPLGWQCSWTSEIEPFPAAVVEHHFGFANVGDMTKITEEMLDEHGPVDLLVGGTPCQSFSVAGLRGGLADPRGNLALRFVQLASVMQPKWIVWENVPGVLSSGKGRDFGTFLGALAELGYGFAYRILDAQWFGVAQRRRRVFVVGYLGDWRRAAAVLFERESVFGNPPTRGKAWEGVAAATPISTRTGRSDDRGDGGDNLIAAPQVANPLTARMGKGINTTCDEGQTPIVSFHPTQDPITSTDGSTHAMGCGSKGGCCTQAVAFKSNLGTRGGDIYEDGSSPTVRVGSGVGIPSPPAVAFKPSHFTRGKDGAPSDVVAPLSADADKGDQDTVIAFAQNTRDEVRQVNGDGQIVGALASQPGMKQTTYVAYDITGTLATNGGKETDCHTALRSRPPGHSEASTTTVVAFSNRTRDGVKVPEVMPDGITPALTNPGGGGRSDAVNVASAMAVRRLTPRECERLQGFPDDYTLVEYRKKPAADGPRYRALGNSMAVPVMRWIGERIAMVERLAGRS
jgi:DNA (cytosine-5)-methyltransferase 1